MCAFQKSFLGSLAPTKEGSTPSQLCVCFERVAKQDEEKEKEKEEQDEKEEEHEEEQNELKEEYGEETMQLA